MRTNHLVLIPAALALLTLSACNNPKSDQGLHVGVQLQDCAAIPADKRQDAAVAIKDLSRDQAVKKLAEMFSVTEDQAKSCLK